MFEQANSAVIGGWGLIISCIGLIVSIAGFGITLHQLSRTRNATQAVEGAIANLKTRINVFDYANECLRASKTFESAIQLLRNQSWLDAAARILEAQSSLNKIAFADEGSEETKSESRSLSENLLAVVQGLEEAFDKDILYESRELILTLRKQINYLELESISVQKGLYNA